MSRYPNGQPLRLSTTVKDLTGTLVNAGTLVLTVQKPDGTTQVYSTPTNDSTGAYHQDIPAADLAQNGHYPYKWVSTGTGAGVSVGSYDVFDPFEPAIIALADVKATLNIPAVRTASDAEIQAKIDTVTAVIEDRIGGPIVQRSITERVRVGVGYRSLAVRDRPLVSVTSITDLTTGTALDISDIELDTVAGIVRRKLQLPFWGRGPYYTVVYVAGLGTAVPAAVTEAARIILQHLWQNQRGGQRPMLPTDETGQAPGLGFSIPNRALELLGTWTDEAYM